MSRTITYSSKQLAPLIQPIAVLFDPESEYRLFETCSVQAYKKNENIYTVGDVPRHLHYLISGSAKSCLAGMGGRQQIIRLLKPSDIFGYRESLADKNRTTTVTTLTDSVVCSIPLEVIVDEVAHNPRLSHYLLHHLSLLLAMADQRLLSLTQKHLRGRIAETLISTIGLLVALLSILSFSLFCSLLVVIAKDFVFLQQHLNINHLCL